MLILQIGMKLVEFNTDFARESLTFLMPKSQFCSYIPAKSYENRDTALEQ